MRVLPHSRAPAQKLVEILGLNRPRMQECRALWIRIVRLASLFDPELFRLLMGYPSDLPELSTLRPRQGNNRPNGITQSHLACRQRGELSETY